MEGTFAILSNEREHWFWNFERALRAIWSVVRSASWVEKWRLDANVRRQGKSAVVRMIWIVRTGESVPRFVTCWVL
jgi:hypothetical protein